nr:immunoglobulin heavy chain junction region [Macaca mulatta]
CARDAASWNNYASLGLDSW